MKNGDWWTFWTLQSTIKDRTGRFFGEPTISASIRNLRKDYAREKYKLNPYGEVIEKRRIEGRKGYEYKLKGVSNG